MKKPFKHDVLSGVKCSVKGCNRFLKANLVARKPTADKCYPCYVWEQGGRDHIMKDLPGSGGEVVEKDVRKKESRQVV